MGVREMDQQTQSLTVTVTLSLTIFQLGSGWNFFRILPNLGSQNRERKHWYTLEVGTKNVALIQDNRILHF